MTVDGVPNVRVCVEPLRAGAQVDAAERLGEPRPRRALAHRQGRRAVHAGRVLLPDDDQAATRVAAVREGAAQPRRARSRRRAGRALAALRRRAPARARPGRRRIGSRPRLPPSPRRPKGRGVVLVDERAPRARGAGRSRSAAPARALGIWEGGLVPVDCGTVLYRYRAERSWSRRARIEQPIVFPGNDLAGVMLPGAVRRLIHDFSIQPGKRAVVLAADEPGARGRRRPARGGRRSAARRRPARAPVRELEAQRRRGRVRALIVDGDEVGVRSGRRLGRTPARVLPARPGGSARRVRLLARRLRPDELPPGVEAVGTVTRRGRSEGRRPARAQGAGQVLRLHLRGRDDQGRHARDRRGLRLHRARQALHDGDDGAVPGPALPARLDAAVRAGGACVRERLGTTTARPPWSPVELGLLAGRPLRARAAHGAARPPRGARRDRCSGRDRGGGRTLLRAAGGRGSRRARVPGRHGRVDAREDPGEGPDGPRFLERLYPNRFATFGPGASATAS